MYADGVMAVPLTQGKFTFVDAADYEWVMQHRWHYHSARYARGRLRSGPGLPPRWVYLHRMILDVSPEYEVDHVNGDRLDNRRCNLRRATKPQQNAHRAKTHLPRSSVFKGVKQYPVDDGVRWRASIRNIHIGSFLNEIDAALAYDAAARQLFGEFAWLNFPDVEMVNV